MPNANPNIILPIPQMQLQAAQTRLMDYLLQAEYAFMQSFSGHTDVTFDIFPPAIPESLQLVLYPTVNGTAVEPAHKHASTAVSPSAQMATLIEELVAVCTAHKGTSR